MKRFLLTLSIFLAIIQLNHCSTILSVSRGDLSLYSGVSSSYSAIGIHHPHNPFAGIMSFLLIIDFPFSFVLDTALVPLTGPVTLYQYIRNRKYTKNQPLFDAVAQNDKNQVAQLLSRGFDANALENEQKITILMRTAALGNVEILKLLIDNKADVKALTTEDESALSFSLYADTEDAYKFLLGYNIPIINKEIVFRAAYTGKEFALLDLLKRSPGIIKEKYSTGQNIAMIATESSISEPTILNLLNQIDINEKDDNGNMLIHFAAKHGKLKVLEFLLSKNVPVDITNGQNETAFLLAAQFNQLAALKLLYDKKSDINSEVNQHALMESVNHDTDDMYKFLISKNMKITNPYILFLVIGNSKNEIASDLLSRIPDAHKLKTENDRELIHYAAAYNHINSVKFCISKNVPIDKKNESDETPLLLAWNYNNLEIFEYLLKNKANANQTINDNGDTLLHIYASDLAGGYGNTKDITYIDMLLSYRIDKKIKNKEGKTAYDILLTAPEPDKEILAKLKP